MQQFCEKVLCIKLLLLLQDITNGNTEKLAASQPASRRAIPLMLIPAVFRKLDCTLPKPSGVDRQDHTAGCWMAGGHSPGKYGNSLEIPLQSGASLRAVSGVACSVMIEFGDPPSKKPEAAECYAVSP